MVGDAAATFTRKEAKEGGKEGTEADVAAAADADAERR